jgi:hypothetical protein
MTLPSLPREPEPTLAEPAPPELPDLPGDSTDHPRVDELQRPRDSPVEPEGPRPPRRYYDY